MLRYREALWTGFNLVRQTGLLTNNHLLAIHDALEQNDAGFRRLPGTVLKDGAGRVVYTPPQEAHEVAGLMVDLERFVHEPGLSDADPLIKMALIHHRFESIHPFYDGNGRTGRILNVLYLVNPSFLWDRPFLRSLTEFGRHGSCKWLKINMRVSGAFCSA